jgi:peptidoglycan/LPS O-acetylase OafA/YrhL
MDSPLNSVVTAAKSELSRDGESSHKFPALHGLRFLAAFCILFSHSCSWLANFKDYGGFNRFGEFFTVYGMPLFFVLSGFVIHYNYSRLFATMSLRWAAIEFVGARIARIYPLFICFLLVGIATDQVLQWWYDHPFNLLLVLGHSLTLTQSWFYIVIFGDRLIVDGPYGLSWSLSTEFFFYLAFIVLVFYIVKLRGLSSLLIAAFGMSVVALAGLTYGIGHRVAINAFAARHLNDHFENWDHSVYRWLYYYSPFVRVFEFILGCIAAQLYARLSETKVSQSEERLGNYLAAASLIYLFVFAYIFLFRPFGPFAAEYIEGLKLNYGCALPIAFLIFCVSRYPASLVAGILSTPLMILLGDLSYSIYTVHTWTLRIFERPEMTFRIGVGLEAAFRIALAVALTIILSSATYRLIEVPARGWLRRAVAQRLARAFGPREVNVISAKSARSGAMMVGTTAFLLLLMLAAAYQFLIVPHFTAYTG